MPHSGVSHTSLGALENAGVFGFIWRVLEAIKLGAPPVFWNDSLRFVSNGDDTVALFVIFEVFARRGVIGPNEELSKKLSPQGFLSFGEAIADL